MASKAVAGAVMTVEEYLALGEDPPLTRLELSEGRLIVAPSSNYLHNAVRDGLRQQVAVLVEQRRLGVVTSETDVGLGEATVRRPDVCFFVKGRLRGRDPEALPLPAPDVAFEILSPHDRKRDLELKVRQYLDAGGRSVWLLDPRSGTIDWRGAPLGCAEGRLAYAKRPAYAQPAGDPQEPRPAGAAPRCLPGAVKAAVRPLPLRIFAAFSRRLCPR